MNIVITSYRASILTRQLPAVKVLDFGLANPVAAPGSLSDSPTSVRLW
jgi:hypothetical protein